VFLSGRLAIEWLLAIDVAELSWEIQRYRLLRGGGANTSDSAGSAVAVNWCSVWKGPFGPGGRICRSRR
jgi:hypothetical protein